MRSKGFIVGFLVGLLTFLVANLYSYYRMINEPVLIDAYVSFGLPFKMYTSGGFTGDLIIWRGLLANIVIVVSVSFLIGLLLKRLLQPHHRPA